MSKSVETEDIHSTQSNKDNLKERLAVSNHEIHNEEKIGKISDIRVVPVIIPRAMKDSNTNRSGNRSLRDLSMYEKERESMPVKNVKPPFNNNLSDIRWWREIKFSDYNIPDKVESIDELFTVKNKNFFYIEPENITSSRYVCQAKFLLIADIESESNLYEESDVIIGRYESIDDLKNDSYLDNKKIEYKFNESELYIRQKPEKFSFSVRKLSTFFLFSISISAFSIIISGLISLIGSAISVGVFLCSVLSLILSIYGIGKYKDSRFAKDRYEKTDRLKYDDYLERSVENVTSKKKSQERRENIMDRVQSRIREMPKDVTVNVDSHRGSLKCEDFDVQWDIMKEDTGIYTEKAVDFFTELGFENPPTRIRTHMIREDSSINIDKKTLKSNCGEWLLIADYIEYDKTIRSKKSLNV